MNSLLTFNDDYTVSHGELINAANIGVYSIGYQLSTKEEIPKSWYCYLPYTSDTTVLNSIFELIYFVEPLDILKQMDENKLISFRRIDDPNYGEELLYVKVLTEVNGYFLFGYLPMSILKKI